MADELQTTNIFSISTQNMIFRTKNIVSTNAHTCVVTTRVENVGGQLQKECKNV